MIHPTAIVASGARLGADVHIGPFAVVGPHVLHRREDPPAVLIRRLQRGYLDIAQRLAVDAVDTAGNRGGRRQ